jgi:RNA-directed DNA polymerase
MKRPGHLIERIAEAKNLRLAFWKASRGKQRSREVVCFRNRLDEELGEMGARICDGSLRFGDYRTFRVFDPKERRITAPSFPERVAHHAIMNVCEPSLEQAAIFHSYACRRGKGQFAALEQARRNTRRFQFCLKLDIRKYFESVDQKVLLESLARRFKDRALLTLIRRLLDSHRSAPGKGLPIGALTSQHFANFYLAPLDRLIVERGVGGYVRYMDDFVAWGDDREALTDVRSRIEAFLADNLKLSLKRRSPVTTVGRGMTFLGYRVFAWGLLPGARMKRRFIRRLREYKEDFVSGGLDESGFQNRLTAACAVVMQARSWRFRRRALDRFGGVSMGLETCRARRELEQPGRELPLRDPEQGRPVEPEPQPGLSCRSCPQLSSDEPDGS